MTEKIKGGKNPDSKSHKADKTAVHGRLDINVMKMMQALRISLGAVMGQIGLPPLEDAKTKDRFILNHDGCFLPCFDSVSIGLIGRHIRNRKKPLGKGGTCGNHGKRAA